MNGLINLIEKKLVPIASKVAAQKHLTAIKDAFMAMLPLTMAGSLAVLVAVLLRDVPTAFNGGEITEFTKTMQPVIEIMIIIASSTLSIMALGFAFSFAYNLASLSKVDPLPAAIVGIAILITTIPTAITADVQKPISAIKMEYLGAGGLFTAIIFTLIFIEIYIKIVKRGITIKMPDTVPSAVSKAFAAIIPGVTAIFGSAITVYVFTSITNEPVNAWISQVIQKPLLELSQGLVAVIAVTIITQLLWFFGLHGMLVLSPVYETLWGVAQIANIEAAAVGKEIPYLWVRGSFDIYGMMGGSGGTLGLLAAMFIVGRRKDTRELATIATGPGIFNINEPLIFGMPIVLNPLYLIPWIVVPTITLTFGFIMTEIGFAGPVVAAVPWITPGVLSAYLATAGSIGAAITAAICLVFTVVAWIPFVVANEKQNLK